MSFTEIDSLLLTLNTAVEVFKAELAAQGFSEPSPNISKPHPIDDPAFLPTPALHEARRAALASLAAGVRLCAEIGLPHLLRDSEEGIHIEEIAAKTGVNARKLERVLRLLITQGWFREPKNLHFANSRLSNLLNHPSGYQAATYMNDLFHRVAGYLPEAINHPEPGFRHHADPTHSAFQVAYDTDIAYLGANSWLAGHPDDSERFSIAMGAIGQTSDAGVLAGFPWEALTKGKDAIVDVGGGQGSLCCSLASLYPNIRKFIVQDLPVTKGVAEAFIASNGCSGRVEFEAHDFFKPQKRTGKYLFVFQRVIHDWSTNDAAKILRQIWDALNEDSALIIIDNLVNSGVVSPEGIELSDSLAMLDDEKHEPIRPPPFIPADFGDSSRGQNIISVALIGLCNTFERTLPELQETVERAGLTITKVHATRGWTSITEVAPSPLRRH